MSTINKSIAKEIVATAIILMFTLSCANTNDKPKVTKCTKKAGDSSTGIIVYTIDNVIQKIAITNANPVNSSDPDEYINSARETFKEYPQPDGISTTFELNKAKDKLLMLTIYDFTEMEPSLKAEIMGYNEGEMTEEQEKDALNTRKYIKKLKEDGFSCK